MSLAPGTKLGPYEVAQLDLEDAGQAPVSELQQQSPRRFSWLPWLVAGLLVLLAAAGWLALLRRPVENPLANAHFTRLTDWEGIERDAAISPDGKFVAFVSDCDGPFDIWLAELGGGEFVNLTRGKDPGRPTASGLSLAAVMPADWGSSKYLPPAGRQPALWQGRRLIPLGLRMAP